MARKQLITYTYILGLFVLFVACSSIDDNKEQTAGTHKDCIKIDSLSDDSTIIESCKEYNSSGVCIREGMYLNSMPNHWHTFYNSEHNIVSRQEFAISTQDSVYTNQIINFDKNGDTLFDESNFFLINYNKKVLAVGDTLIVDFYLRAPYFHSDSMIVYVANPDGGNKEYHLFSTNNRKRFKYVTKKINRYIIPGTLTEIHKEVAKEMTRDMTFNLFFEVR